MARPLRIEFPGATHHVTSRGNDGRTIFQGDLDFETFLVFLGAVTQRLGWSVTSYTLMTNHFHLVITTPQPNLSKGMQWLNGKYAAWFNRHHKRSGHLFQGRFKSFLIDTETYFQTVSRYVVLNPVRASMTQRPEDYRWSSYRAMVGLDPGPAWLDTGAVIDAFGTQELYRDFVFGDVPCEERLWDKVRNGMFLGSDDWAKRMRAIVESKPRSTDHPRIQRAVGRPLMADVIAVVARIGGASVDAIRHQRGHGLRCLAAWLGWNEGWLTLASIGAALRLRSEGHVSGLIRRCEEDLGKNQELLGKLDQALTDLRPRAT
jgi:putative transposase